MTERNGEKVLSPVAHVTVDGTVWPIADGAEWTLRYGTAEAREAQRMGVASILSAYAALVDPNRPQYVAVDMLKRARRAAVDHFGRTDASATQVSEQ